MQKTVEAALATVLQTAGYGLLIIADEWKRVFRMGGFDDVCGALPSIIVTGSSEQHCAHSSAVCSIPDAMPRWQMLQHRDQGGASSLYISLLHALSCVV